MLCRQAGMKSLECVHYCWKTSGFKTDTVGADLKEKILGLAETLWYKH